MELLEILTNDEEVIDYFEYVDRPRRPYILRNRRDHFNEWDEYDFFDRFRLQKGTVQVLLHRIEGRVFKESVVISGIIITYFVFIDHQQTAIML